jgi:hypothetical protein
LFVCADENLTYSYNGKRYSPLIHSLYEDLERLNLKVSLINRSASKYTPKEIFGTSYTINKLLKSINHLNKYRGLIYGDISRFIHNSLISHVEMWIAILQRVNPKFIIGIQPPMELCIASNLLGIKIADLQHGLLSCEGYYGKKYRDCCNQLGWPNHILCWDVESEEWVNNNIFSYVDPIIIGNPWINRFIVREKNDNLVNDEFIKFTKKTDEKPTILVSLQYATDGENLNSIGIPYALLDYIKIKGHRFNWLLRIHPIILNNRNLSDINDEFCSVFSKYDNIEWLLCSKAPLPIVFLKSNLHITWNSAVAKEASWFGIKTAVLDPHSLNFFNNDIKSGYIDFVENNIWGIDKWIDSNRNFKKANLNFSFKSKYLNFINYLVNLN